MFFLLSKLADTLLQPIFWLFCGLLLATWFGKQPAGRRLLIGTTIAFFLLSNDYLANMALSRWEAPAVPLAALHRPYPVAVVLGGFSEVDKAPRDRVHLNQAADRLLDGVLLYKRGSVQRLLISGGNSSLVDKLDSEAKNGRLLAVMCAVPQAAILPEPRARTTRENALYSKQILDSLHIADTVLLITSASHARRAGACFARLDVPYRLFPCDFRASPAHPRADAMLIPTLAALAKWELMVHEWFGLAVYYVRGYV